MEKKVTKKCMVNLLTFVSKPLFKCLVKIMPSIGDHTLHWSNWA